MKNNTPHIDFSDKIKDEASKAVNEYKGKTSDIIPPSIVEAMCLGDQDAFRKVYLHSYDKLKEFLHILLRDEDDAEEVVQDIFLYILENRDKIDPNKNFKGYLFTIARTKAFDHMSRKKLDAKYYDYKLNSSPDFAVSPDEVVMSNELALLISIYIDNMPPQRKRVYELSFFEDKSISEIAEMMKLSQQTVKNYLHMATKGLRDLIALFAFLFLY